MARPALEHNHTLRSSGDMWGRASSAQYGEGVLAARTAFTKFKAPRLTTSSTNPSGFYPYIIACTVALQPYLSLL